MLNFNAKCNTIELVENILQVKKCMCYSIVLLPVAILSNSQKALDQQ